MATVTNAGTGTLTTLMVSTGSSLVLPQFQSTSLLQNSSVTVSGSGHTVLFLGRVETTNNGQCQVEIDVDDVAVYGGAAGENIIARMVLSSGSHTIKFSAFALSNDVEAEVFGLTIVDLGL